MTYIINKSDGSILTIINDGTIDNTSTSLVLHGKKYKDWGENVNENFVKLLENFSNSSPPPNPLNGQLWYDSSTNTLKIYDASISSWKNLFTISSDIDIFSQKFTTPSSGVLVGFIHDDQLVEITSPIEVSASLLDNSTINPKVNAQTEFPYGVGKGINLSLNKSSIYGQDVLDLGVNSSITGSPENAIRIDNLGNVSLSKTPSSTYRLNVSGISKTDELRSSLIKLSAGSNSYFLPTNAGTAGQILYTAGNGNFSYWADFPSHILNPEMIKNSNGGDNYIFTSAYSSAISFVTNNDLRMIITSAGYFGLGTQNPEHGFHIYNDVVSFDDPTLAIQSNNAAKIPNLKIIFNNDTGDEPVLGFYRSDTNKSNVNLSVGENIGSIKWFQATSLLDYMTTPGAEIRSVIKDPGFNDTYAGTNLEFYLQDNTGNQDLRFEIASSGSLIIYNSDGTPGHYLLPSSAGNNDDILTSRGNTKQLIWKKNVFYEFVTAYSTNFLGAGKKILGASFSGFPTQSQIKIYSEYDELEYEFYIVYDLSDIVTATEHHSHQLYFHLGNTTSALYFSPYYVNGSLNKNFAANVYIPNRSEFISNGYANLFFYAKLKLLQHANPSLPTMGSLMITAGSAPSTYNPADLKTLYNSNINFIKIKNPGETHNYIHIGYLYSYNLQTGISPLSAVQTMIYVKGIKYL